MGSIALQFDKNNMFKGGDREGSPVTASGSLFAGANAGGTVTGAFEWDNPEVRQEAGAPGWKTLFSISSQLKASIGIGGELDFYLYLSDATKKISFKAKAGLVIGKGAGGSIFGVVEPGNIWELIKYIYYEIRDTDFNFADWIQEELFVTIYQLSAYMIVNTVKEVESIITAFKDAKKWLEKRKKKGKSWRKKKRRCKGR